MTNNKRKNVALTISVVLLFLALFSEWPYGFYTLLRFIVCATTAYVAWIAYTEKKERWIWIFGFIAVLFNPFIPVYLNREIWVLLDFIIGLFLLGTVIFFRLDKKEVK